MVGSVTGSGVKVGSEIEGGQEGYGFALSTLTMLFFMWGFITCLNDILIPHLKNVFSLNYTQAMLIQFCFFGAYFLVSLPAGKLVKAVGYQRGIVIGLLIASVGCLLFLPAARFHSYPFFLSALFVLASGITVLQVSANPYVTVLGKPDTASSRLNLTQAFNSLGTTLAPLFGGLLILSVASSGMEAQQAKAVELPYLLLAVALFVLALIFSFIKLPIINEQEGSEDPQESVGDKQSAWSFLHLKLGALAIFLYVGAEVSIGSLLVNFFGEAHIAGLEESQAAHYVTYFWGGAMAGRFIGAAVMRRISAAKMLVFNSVAAVVLIALAVFSSGALAMWSILLVGLCNSIMFPTIFSLALRGLGPHTSQGSGILCLAIVGGAIIPLIQGVTADALGVQMAFLLPLFCYLYIAYFGLKGSEFKIGGA